MAVSGQAPTVAHAVKAGWGIDWGAVDNLSLAYNGNQPVSVRDTGTPSTWANSMDFKDGNKVGDDYAYDKNGNMTKDLSKNILSIQYNSLNSPDYVYTVDGGRHASCTTTTGTSSTPTPTTARGRCCTRGIGAGTWNT